MYFLLETKQTVGFVDCNVTVIPILKALACYLSSGRTKRWEGRARSEKDASTTRSARWLGDIQAGWVRTLGATTGLTFPQGEALGKSKAALWATVSLL